MSALDRSIPEVIDAQTEKRKERPPKRDESTESFFLVRRAGAIWAALSSYARAHRRWFVKGSVCALVLVAVRVAMPWPLQLLIKPWLNGGQSGASGLFSWHPAVVVGLAYALMVTLLGFVDYRLRLNFARFAIGTVRDVRAGVIRELGQMRRLHPKRTTGDWVTRLIGDSARLKAGLKGFLVHVATNGLLFLGISAVMLWIEWSIGLIFLTASVLTILVTALGAARIFRLAIKFRRKESKIAHTITERLALHEEEEGEEDEDGMEAVSLGANRKSGKYEASITRIQGLTTWSVHFILAIAVPAGLWQGYRAVENGSITPGDLFVVMLYALMILGPMVRLARQGARSGKILANADRLRELLQESDAEAGEMSPGWAPLRERIALEKAEIRTRVNGVKTRRFGPVTLQIEAGQRIAVIGKPGVGKSTLLSLLAGRERYRGSVKWDGSEFREAHLESLDEQIAYVAQVPSWPQLDSSEIVSACAARAPGDPIRALLKHAGLQQLRLRLEKQGEGKIPFEEVSHSECKALALIRFRTSGQSLKLIDDPVSEIASNRSARKLLSAFLRAQRADQTVIVALDRPVALKRFDRVIVLKNKGRVKFDGSPADWKLRQQLARQRAEAGDGDGDGDGTQEIVEVEEPTQ